MSFDWDDYLIIAKKIQVSTKNKPDNNNNEALRRIAVSRAYYAIYHCAVNYAERNFGYIPVKGEGGNDYHTQIRSQYKIQSGNYKHQEVGKLLFNLNKSRKDCDYNSNNIGNIEKLLESSIIQASRIEEILTN